MPRLMILLGSLFKLVTALAVLGWGLRAGWNQSEDKQLLDKAPVIVTVLLATFPPVGFFLYYKYWEEKPPLSSACMVQAFLGIGAIVIFNLVNHYSPVMPAW